MEPQPPQNQNPTITYTCLSCTMAFESTQDHDILCAEGHFFCATNKCSQLYLDLIFSEPHNYYPGKCPMCKTILPQDQLTKLMTEAQKQVFSDLEAKFGADAEKTSTKPVEILVEEINKLDTAVKLEEMKKIVEEMIEHNSQVFCPGCQTGGRKDLECNHMVCYSCDIQYCYICAKEESVLNKADEDGDIYSHNEQWHYNEERCPMYFKDISGIDNRYSVDEGEAMNLFHQLKIKMALKELFLSLDENDVRGMEEEFKILEKYKIDVEELLDQEQKIVLIKREVV